MGSSHTFSTAYIRDIGACLQLSIAVNAFLNTAVCFVLLVIMLIPSLTLGDQPSPAIANLLRSVRVVIKGAVSRNSAKLGNYKMPVELGKT